MGTLKTIFDIQLLSTIIFQPLHHLESNWKKMISNSQFIDEDSITSMKWTRRSFPILSWKMENVDVATNFQ